MSISGRRVYRVAHETLTLLSVRLFSESGDPLGPAELSDLSLNGLGALVGRADRESVRHGARLLLEISLPNGGVIGAFAHVRFLVDLPESIRVGLEFDNPDAIRAEIPATVFHLFNRRRSERTHDVDLRARIDLLDGDCLPGRVVSLSLHGAGLRILSGAELDLQPGRPVAVSFWPEGMPDGISLVASITASGLRVFGERQASYVGVAFDPQATPDFKTRSAEILHVVREASNDVGGT